MSSNPSSATGPRIAAGALAAAFVAALVLLFVVLYFAVQPLSTSLVVMGILALVLALVAYLAQSFSRDPNVQRAVSWGLAAMGFALLFATVWLVPGPGTSETTQLLQTLVLVVLLVIALALISWRVRSTASTQAREERRAAWDQGQPPSAFDYAAARTPGTGTVGGPSSPPSQRSP